MVPKKGLTAPPAAPAAPTSTTPDDAVDAAGAGRVETHGGQWPAAEAAAEGSESGGGVSAAATLTRYRRASLHYRRRASFARTVYCNCAPDDVYSYGAVLVGNGFRF